MLHSHPRTLPLHLSFTTLALNVRPILTGTLLFLSLACNSNGNLQTPSSPPAQPKPTLEGISHQPTDPSGVQGWLKEYVRQAEQQNLRATLLETVPSQQWRVSFADGITEGAPLDIDVAVHEQMTVIMAPLLTLPAHTSKELLVKLLLRNYEMFQAKFALNEAGLLYLGFEVPNRLLDEQELRDNLESLRLSAASTTTLLQEAVAVAQAE